MLIITQPWPFLLITSVVIVVESKTCNGVIFTDPVAERSKLTFLQKMAQALSFYSFLDIFISDFINSFYS